MVCVFLNLIIFIYRSPKGEEWTHIIDDVGLEGGWRWEKTQAPPQAPASRVLCPLIAVDANAKVIDSSTCLGVFV